MSYKSNLTRADRTSEAMEFPSVFLIDNFNGCNLKCSACDHGNVSKYRRIQKMGMGLYKKIIDEIAEKNKNARIWEIFFGDPFLCGDMDQRIKYAKEKGLTDVVLNTNGVLMTENKSKLYIQAGLDAIYVGVDAGSEETYNKIRIGGDYHKVIQNVLSYHELLKKIGNGKQKIFTQFVQSDVNEHEVNAFKEFWTSRGVSVKIRPKISWGGLVNAPNLHPNESVKRKPCYWLMRTMNICADGEVALCSADIHCRVKCGNVVQHSIEELWGGKLREYRTMHKEGKFDELPDMCKNCCDWQSAYADFF